MILYYGEKEGKKKWKEYKKITELSLDNRLIRKYGNKAQLKINEYKNKLSNSLNEYNKNRTIEEKRSNNIFCGEY
jgi:hypothetical protein